MINAVGEGKNVFKSIVRGAAFVACACIHAIAVQAATLLETTELVGATAAADAGVPDAASFDVTTAGSYRLTLTDLRTPQQLGSLRAVVTHDLAVVAEVQVQYPGAPLQPASVDFAAIPGKYRVHVLGAAGAGAASGGFVVNVAPAMGGTALLNHSGSIDAPAQASDGFAALQVSFTITQAANYRLQLNDLAFPAALSSLQALVLQETGGGPVPVVVTAGSFAATPGTYQLIIAAQAAAPTLAGLYSVTIDSLTGPVVYRTTQSVGNLPPARSVAIATAGSHTLTLADLNFPAALTTMRVVATQDGAVLGTLNAAGTALVTAAQGTLHIHAYATPAAAADVGAFSVQLARGGQDVYADAWIADASSASASPTIYSVESSAALAAGNYQLRIEDFAFPLAFAALRVVVVQGATVMGTLNAAGTTTVALGAARVKLLVAVEPPAGAAHNALFGLTLTPSGSNTPVLETTQGAGGFFRTHVVTLLAAGAYDLALRDLGFPSNMATAAVAITRGTSLVAQIYGGGTVPRQSLTPGTYVLNFLGEPAAGAAHGTYGLKVADSPPQPVVTLTAASTNITSGASASLQWSATNATTCTASNGWSGAKAVSGTESAGPLNANTTFALACTGPGGTGNASVAVTVTAPSASGSGGGAVEVLLLMGLALLGMARALRPRAAARSYI